MTSMPIAEQTASILLETESIKVRPHDPFRFVSGRLSPVYVDCRQLISFPKERSLLMKFMHTYCSKHINMDEIDFIAGGETAGIPYGTLMAQSFNKPLIYIRKENKAYGRTKRIEGVFKEHPHIQKACPRVLLIEDQATDGHSKISFVDAIREAGGSCHDCMVIFYYDIFKAAKAMLGAHDLTLHSLATWWDVLAYMEAHAYLAKDEQRIIRNFLENPPEA